MLTFVAAVTILAVGAGGTGLIYEHFRHKKTVQYLDDLNSARRQLESLKCDLAARRKIDREHRRRFEQIRQLAQNAARKSSGEQAPYRGHGHEAQATIKHIVKLAHPLEINRPVPPEVAKFIDSFLKEDGSDG